MMKEEAGKHYDKRRRQIGITEACQPLIRTTMWASKRVVTSIIDIGSEKLMGGLSYKGFHVRKVFYFYNSKGLGEIWRSYFFNYYYYIIL
jgi:hypothetical protein